MPEKEKVHAAKSVNFFPTPEPPSNIQFQFPEMLHLGNLMKAGTGCNVASETRPRSSDSL